MFNCSLVPKVSVEDRAMQYLASHYWHSANENSPSLLLQQMYHKQKQLPVLMACVCSNDINSRLGKTMVTGLADWFYATGLPLVDSKGEKGIAKIGRKLERYLNQQKNIMEGIRLSGVFCVGEVLFLWKKGGAKIWLMNQRNLNAHVTELYPGKEDERGLVFQKGFIQREVGLLLSTESFGHPKVVNVKEWKDQSGVEKCLQEMGCEATARGAEKIGAILLITK